MIGWDENRIARRIAEDIEPGWIVNLGIGLPSRIGKFAGDLDCLFHSENGLIGMGRPAREDEIDPDLIDPAKAPVTMVNGAALMDSSVSFAMMRGGHLDLSVLGAYQVSVDGDLSNWSLPGHERVGIGGAADLVAGCKRIWVAMKHLDPYGRSRIVKRCTFPLTGTSCVSRVYSDLGVFRLEEGTLVVQDLAPGVSMNYLREIGSVPIKPG